MKKIILLFSSLTFVFSVSDAQLLNRLKNAAQRGAERAVENTAERKTNQATEEILNGKDKSRSPATNTPKKSRLEEEESESFFKPGKTIIYRSEFSKVATGSFPADWNSNGNAEIKKLKGFDEKWLDVKANAVISMDFKRTLPDNFTIEMDLLVPEGVSRHDVGIGLGAVVPKKMDHSFNDEKTFEMIMRSVEGTTSFDALMYNDNRGVKWESWRQAPYTIPLDEKIHLAIMVEGSEHLTVWADNKKLLDLPRGLNKENNRHLFLSAVTSGAAESMQNHFYVTNIVVAK